MNRMSPQRRNLLKTGAFAMAGGNRKLRMRIDRATDLVLAQGLS
jgi:hypothetical protein